ncbi:MAG: methyltransferase [Candidatus Micrarchaeota archaeon]|nr:methyltransferase [Candidatus Micrarchaeota archaeon]
MHVKDIKLNECRGVYEPREDSYMLAESVNMHAFGKVLDLGTGTGIQGIVAALKGCEVTFSDIDEKALECARANAEQNGVSGKFLRSDMFDSIGERFNTIVFNPPYVISKEMKHLALDGGENGRHYIDRFIGSYKEHVLDRHCVLIVESSFNRFEKDVERLHAEIVSKGHYFFEDIAVLRF